MSMDYPFQPPVGGGGNKPPRMSQFEDEEEEEEDSIMMDLEQEQRMPLTPREEEESNSSTERFQERNRSYLSFFRSPVPSSSRHCHELTRSMVGSSPQRTETAFRRRDPLVDEDGSSCSPREKRLEVDLAYSSTHSQSTTTSFQQPPPPQPVIPPGMPPQLARSQMEGRMSLGSETRRAAYSPRTPDSSASQASRLFGESLLSGRKVRSAQSRGQHYDNHFAYDDCDSTASSMATSQQSNSGGKRGFVGGVVDALRQRATMDTTAAALAGHQASQRAVIDVDVESCLPMDNDSSTSSSSNYHQSQSIHRTSTSQQPRRVSLKRREWLENMDSYVQTAGQKMSQFLQPRRHHVPLSPHSRELQDLEFLQAQHLQKMQALQRDEDEDIVYDFCLVLTPQQVYAFWAALLDFRVELLGKEVVEAMEQQWQEEFGRKLDQVPEESNFDENSVLSTAQEIPSEMDEEAVVEKEQPGPSTPKIDENNVSLRSPLTARNKRDELTPLGQHKKHPLRPPLHRGMSINSLTPAGRSTTKMTMPSPGIYSVGDFSRVSRSSRQSMFERAIGVTPQSSAVQSGAACNGEKEDDLGAVLHGSIRRKWGKSQSVAPISTAATPNEKDSSHLSPRMGSSITRGISAIRRPPVQNQSTNQQQPSGPHEIRIEDIPNQVIPRAIAARNNLMLPFLSVLRRGIILRRHRPGHVAMYCKLFSTDGGDTLQYQWVNHNTAMAAFEEQRQRYSKEKQYTHPIPWEQMATPNSHEPRTGRKGTFRAADMVAVHPTHKADPRSLEGHHGSVTLRRSKSDYFEERSFTVVCRARAVASLDEYDIKWHNNEGNESQFRYFDFETATEGEYWLVFRGFLMLQRDAAVGRFADQRSAGIGSNYVNHQQRFTGGDQRYRLHADEFLEPVTAGFMEKMIVNWRGLDPKYMVGDKKDGALPPPSDYFLGFKSPGTAIWSRLRYAGFYTQRIYAIDPNRVVLKISCPNYRLMDVAEVLKLKVKTEDGKSFAPFRQDMIDIFKPLDDPLEEANTSAMHGDFQFSSADRQSIIDFIIRSRIRDSGAELGEATAKRPSGLDNLGRMVQARVPLHMSGKLDVICQAWVFYWKREHWTGGRNGKSLTYEVGVSDDRKSLVTASSDSLNDEPRPVLEEKEKKVPSRFMRFFVGALFQPLTSIQGYFGEKVAFYFAWLQHTAMHLTVLTAAGIVVFLVQISTGKWDTRLRPYFAVFVMLWTFVVLVNWRKRANFLAYEWGTLNHMEQETTRPQFHGEFVKDEITGEDVLHYPKWKRWLKYCISFPIILIFNVASLFLILWVHSNRDLQLARYLDNLENDGEGEDTEFHIEFGFSALSQKKPVVELELTRELLFNPRFLFLLVGMPALLGLCLPLLNFFLMRLSVVLNNFENYRTVSEYNAHLIIKVFSFRFVSHFAVVYYYSFVSVGSEQAIENGFLRVAAAVLVYTTVARWWENFLHVAFPILLKRIKLRYFDSKLGEQLREIELEEEAIGRLSAVNGMTEELKKRQIAVVNRRLLLDQAQDPVWQELMLPAHDSFPEYIQAIVQFTFVSCFSVVLPITPLICLINYLISMRLDAYKLCKGRRRPLAEKTGGIGVWEHLLHIVAVISVLTNCWLIGFTSEQFIKLGEKVGQVSLFAIVVCWEHTMLLIKYVMQSTMSPLPKTVKDAMKKEQHELDEQRNKSMGRRRRRPKLDRGNRRPSRFANDDDFSTTSSMETDSLLHEQPLPPKILTPSATANCELVNNALYSA